MSEGKDSRVRGMRPVKGRNTNRPLTVGTFPAFQDVEAGWWQLETAEVTPAAKVAPTASFLFPTPISLLTLPSPNADQPATSCSGQLKSR